jgi:CDP-glucose 4,6-dehydratase
MKNFYKNKKVLVTGHTGFKGSWLSLYLNLLGSKVYGISLKPKYKNNNFELSKVKKILKKNYIFDLRDKKKFETTFNEIEPDIIFHLAAQPLVGDSYKNPYLTWTSNLLSTLHLCEIIKVYKKKIICVVITSDKCYENLELTRGYKEEDRLGGKDPYSASKGSVELLCKSYYHSFFQYNSNIKFATARAGNVIGGGDWSKDRLIPDVINSIQKNKIVEIRNPKSTRPWQHVLEPLNGYLCLASKLKKNKRLNGESFNFGPGNSKNYNVESIIKFFKKFFPNFNYKVVNENNFHESNLLKLNCEKSKKLLNWKQKMNISDTIDFTAGWYKNYFDKKDNFEFTINQIKKYLRIKK